MSIPRKISPCPIIESIVEIRFETDLPGDAVFGIAYKEFKSDYSRLEKLPILQIPEPIRSIDPNLMFSPHYKLFRDNLILQVGPKTFSLVCTEEYPGWEFLSKRIDENFSRFLTLGIVNKISRIGLRFVNFFKNLNIYEHSNLNVTIGEDCLGGNTLSLLAEIKSGTLMSTLRTANAAVVNIKGEDLKGSIVDIDTETQSGNSLDAIIEAVKAAHDEEKRIFFSLLEKKFLDTLNPEY